MKLNSTARATILTAALVLILAPAAFADHPGLLDPTLIDHVFEGSTTTSIELNGDQIAGMIQSNDPDVVEVLEVLENIVAVRVRSAKITPDQQAPIADAFTDTAEDLKNQGWNTIVQVRDPGETQVDILLRNDDDIIRGVVVLFADETEAGFVNLAGDVSMAQVMTIMQQTDIMGDAFVGMSESEIGDES